MAYATYIHLFRAPRGLCAREKYCEMLACVFKVLYRVSHTDAPAVPGLPPVVRDFEPVILPQELSKSSDHLLRTSSFMNA